jgi:hypothetical protein
MPWQTGQAKRIKALDGTGSRAAHLSYFLTSFFATLPAAVSGKS